MLNSSFNLFRDSPNSRGLYKRRNRSGRYFQKQNSVNNTTDDCIILPDNPPEVISLLDTDDEHEKSNKKRKQPPTHANGPSPKRNKKIRQPNFSPKAGPSDAAKLRYPTPDALVPFFIDTKKDDAPVMQIPLYKSNNDSIICLDDTLPQPLTSSTGTKYESVLSDSVVIVEDESQVEKGLDASLEEGEIPPDDSFIPLESGPAVSFKGFRGPEGWDLFFSIQIAIVVIVATKEEKEETKSDRTKDRKTSCYSRWK